ncbi:DUF7553 family protein [Halopiger xanaduensis]|uniref:Uncharacterized protein n=1 Tax=Halopiger xanaduensis (strain DSM 18323 / JCM 14033 / SH-6) TaxID=797210 RepID=F8DC08_HALXS|nr:hypothetical protein [Halopiger xanaduensis]AEH35985.1 hypothetical protein Halxa_1352 [Halopiger xanaduensis SH-6]
MSREHLADAAESLQTAADATSNDDARERLENQSSEFEDLANADRGPDHGKLARHEHILTDIADEEGGEVAEHVEEALESIRAFRSTVDGV